MGYERCDYCGGTGSVLDTPNNIVSGQRPTGMGTITCPRCGGSGQGQYIAPSTVSYEGSGDGSGFYVFLCLLATGLGAAVFYYLYEIEIAGYIGAAIGFGLSMINESIREAVINTIAILVILISGVVIIGLLSDAFLG